MLTGEIQSWKPSQITPRDLPSVTSVTFPQLELQLFSFTNSTSQLPEPPGEESSEVLLETKTQHGDAAKDQVQFCCKQDSDHKHTDLVPAVQEHLRLDFLFSSSGVQNEITSQPGLKGFSAPLEQANNFSDLF